MKINTILPSYIIIWKVIICQLYRSPHPNIPCLLISLAELLAFSFPTLFLSLFIMQIFPSVSILTFSENTLKCFQQVTTLISLPSSTEVLSHEVVPNTCQLHVTESPTCDCVQTAKSFDIYFWCKYMLVSGHHYNTQRCPEGLMTTWKLPVHNE